MNRLLPKVKSVFVFIVVAVWAGGASGAGFLWPASVTPGTVPPIFAASVLGRPDGRVADFRAGSTSAKYGDFGSAEEFDPVEFAGVLGVSVEVLASAHFVAFEAWGTSFELSTWNFMSNAVALVVEAPGECLVSGTISTEAYATTLEFPGTG